MALLDFGYDAHIAGDDSIGSAGANAELSGGGFVVSIVPAAADAGARADVDQAVELDAGRILEGGVAFIQKPFTPTALLQKVREVLDGTL